ncbi:hypothetical protein J3R30DRAFT_3682835, partial [Lentinula aciculospora]
MMVHYRVLSTAISIGGASLALALPFRGPSASGPHIDVVPTTSQSVDFETSAHPGRSFDVNGRSLIIEEGNGEEKPHCYDNHQDGVEFVFTAVPAPVVEYRVSRIKSEEQQALNGSLVGDLMRRNAEEDQELSEMSTLTYLDKKGNSHELRLFGLEGLSGDQEQAWKRYISLNNLTPTSDSGAPDTRKVYAYMKRSELTYEDRKGNKCHGYLNTLCRKNISGELLPQDFSYIYFMVNILGRSPPATHSSTGTKG